MADTEDLVTPGDIEISLGRPLTPREIAQVGQMSTDAQVILRSRFPDLSKLDQDALKYVVREAIVFKLKRPDPASQTTVTIDDGTVAKRYERDTGAITILPEWWILLTPRAAADHGAFTIRPGRTSPRFCG
ncbi:MAG: Phage protein Gp19/Gp15/Gp42 [Nocardioidaceae bacterium]|nr:Phage protein Gp19/Gp15/Gp42 [Nocardioidaceae bacterium]